jgi:putative membrane protein
MARSSMIRLSSAAPIAAAVLGAFAATAIIGYFNYHTVLRAMAPVGWGGSGLVIASQLALMAPLGLAWYLVAPGEPLHRLWIFVWGRLMREAASDVLPFSQLGGFVIAARAMVVSGVAGATAVGSGVVDLTVEIVAQIIYTLLGVALLVTHFGAGAGADRLVYAVSAGVVIVALMVSGFVFAQRRGLAPLERLARRFAPGAAAHSAAVNRVVVTAYGMRTRLWSSLAAHVSCWIASAAATWLILWLIGHPLPIMSVVTIESLLFAIKNAAFVVPTGIGVQEGAYAILGPMFGLPVEAALALSLLKRGRDILIGVPVLLAWQVMEGRRSRDASTQSTMQSDRIV